MRPTIIYLALKRSSELDQVQAIQFTDMGGGGFRGGMQNCIHGANLLFISSLVKRYPHWPFLLVSSTIYSYVITTGQGGAYSS